MARVAAKAKTKAPTTAVNLRGVPVDVAERMKRAAAARQWTLPAYVARLVDLHDALRIRADDGDKRVAAVLADLGLESVTR